MWLVIAEQAPAARGDAGRFRSPSSRRCFLRSARQRSSSERATARDAPTRDPARGVVTDAQSSHPQPGRPRRRRGRPIAPGEEVTRRLHGRRQHGVRGCASGGALRSQDRPQGLHASMPPCSSTAFGSASRPQTIELGDYVHTHNVRPRGGRHGVFGYRRPDGSVASRNHVIVLPVDDISNAACEGVASKISRHACAAARLRPAAVRRGPRASLPNDDRHGVEPERRSGSRHRHRAELDAAHRRGIAETGKPVVGFSIEGQGDLETVRQASRAAMELRSVGDASSSGSRSICRSSIVSIKCGESDTTTGLGSCPTVGEAVDRLVDAGATVIFGETSELTGGEHLVADRMAIGGAP